jgi:hypothetical protein
VTASTTRLSDEVLCVTEYLDVALSTPHGPPLNIS